MTEYSSPLSYNYRYNYSLFALLEYMGRQGLYNVAYRYDGSESNIQQYHTNVFTKMGYKSTGDFMNFSASSAAQTLKTTASTKNPILVRGSSEKGGHAWVIDGCIIKKGNFGAMTPDNPTGEAIEYFFRCVWGWGGSNNGYFRWNQSATLGGERYDESVSGVVGNMGYTSEDNQFHKEYFGNLRYRNIFIPNN